MKYIKIKGFDLIEVLGNGARKMDTIGVEFLPQHQMIDKDKKVSYGTITDETKFEIKHNSITIFNTIDELNLDIDAEYDEVFILQDVQILNTDRELSGNPAIPGYDADLPLTDQVNLKALFDANMGGIVKNKKAEYFK